jgi:hypothetical protein
MKAALTFNYPLPLEYRNCIGIHTYLRACTSKSFLLDALYFWYATLLSCIKILGTGDIKASAAFKPSERH